MLIPQVKAERTGWRDAGLSARHRMWGYDCPAFDLDFVMVEYDCAKVVGLVEYKQENAPPPNYKATNYRALVDLGNSASVPVFSVRYGSDYSWYQATALNDAAKKWFSGDVKMSEREWVNLLYRIRRRKMPDLPFDGTKEISHRKEDDDLVCPDRPGVG